MECVYALQSFGIPSNQFPLVAGTNVKSKKRKKETRGNAAAVDENNNDNDTSNHLNLNNHIKWLELSQLKDKNMKLDGKKGKNHVGKYHGFDGHQQIIECPKHSDILLGRGKHIMKHPGNAVLRSIVTSKVDEYIKLESHMDTVKLTLDVVSLLKNMYGAQFLKEEITETDGKLGCWIEISNEAARNKVRVAFRDKIKQQQSDKQQQLKQQTQLFITSPIMQPMIMATTDNNNNTPNNSNNYPQIQQLLQVDEEEADSSTSMFLSMTGDNNGCGCGGTTNTGKKRQLEKKSCFSHPDGV